MPWKCRLVPAPGDVPGSTPWRDLKVGDMWFAPFLLEHPPGHIFRPSPNYFRESHHREPLVVRLPGPVDWGVDGCAWTNGQPYGDGWKVSGEPPLITVQPSINIGSTYHGFLIDGVIGDDVEGRKYDERGYLLERAGA